MICRTLEPEVMDTVEEAVDYDSMDHSAVNRLFVDDLLSFIGDTTGPTSAAVHVLDLGTGTALIPIELLQTSATFESVLACDLSKEMLKIARQNLSRARLDQSILPLFCDAKRLPLANQSCEIVMSNSIVHHIPNPMDVFHEMRRVIRPGGTLFVRDLLRPDSVDQVEHLVRTYAGHDNSHQQKMFRESLHAALTVAEVQQLLRDSGFPAAWVTQNSDRHWTIQGQCD